jgi:hypothetical protein
MTAGPLPIPRRFLILACSATKRPDPAPIPARDRYDGLLWRTLRATDPRGRRARVGILSARYGSGTHRRRSRTTTHGSARISPRA